MLSDLLVFIIRLDMRASLSQETLNDFLFVKESMGLEPHLIQGKVAKFCKIHCKKMYDTEEGPKISRWWIMLVPICLYCSNFKLHEMWSVDS